MEYYVFIWDMRGSTVAIEENEQETLDYLHKLADFCLEYTSELPKVEVLSLGDGQQVLFPVETSYDEIVEPFCESVLRYARKLSSETSDYAISYILGKGQLENSSLGKQSALLWKLNTALQTVPAGQFLNLVK